MNEIVKKFLLEREKFIPEIHLRQPGFTYSAGKPLTQNKQWIPKFKETVHSQYIYQNELDKPCFQHDMAYGDFKDLPRRIAADKILRDKYLTLLNIENMMDVKRVLLHWFTIFL